MPTNEIISDRLKKLEEILNIPPLRMAELGNCSRSTYYRYRNGESSPDVQFLSSILKNENDINTEWLLKGEGPVLKRHQYKSESRPVDANSSTFPITFVNIPFYSMKPEKSNGEGAVSLSTWKDPSRTLPMCNFYFKIIINSEPGDLIAIRVKCDSMSPDVKPNSLVFVDQQEANPSVDGIFVVRMDDVIRMKLVQRLPSNRVKLSTINKKFRPIEINLQSEKNFEILGRVIWVGSPA